MPTRQGAARTGGFAAVRPGQNQAPFATGRTGHRGEMAGPRIAFAETTKPHLSVRRLVFNRAEHSPSVVATATQATGT